MGKKWKIRSFFICRAHDAFRACWKNPVLSFQLKSWRHRKTSYPVTQSTSKPVTRSHQVSEELDIYMKSFVDGDISPPRFCFWSWLPLCDAASASGAYVKTQNQHYFTTRGYSTHQTLNLFQSGCSFELPVVNTCFSPQWERRCFSFLFYQTQPKPHGYWWWRFSFMFSSSDALLPLLSSLSRLWTFSQRHWALLVLTRSSLFSTSVLFVWFKAHCSKRGLCSTIACKTCRPTNPRSLFFIISRTFRSSFS